MASNQNNVSVAQPAAASPPAGAHATILVLFISLGGLSLFTFLVASLCWFVRNKRKSKMEQKTDAIDVDEHLKVKESVVQGPHGTEAVTLSVEEDVHFQEKMSKNKIDKASNGTSSSDGFNQKKYEV
ncbi:hypothetical protein ACHQM5_016921 [Ranunculus cassubicifolius]